MSLLAVVSEHGFEYINLALAERVVPLDDGCVEVQFSRTIVTLRGIDAQQALRWAQQQSEQLLRELEHSCSRPLTATPAKPRATRPLPASESRTLNLPNFSAGQQPDTVSRPPEPSWRLR